MARIRTIKPEFWTSEDLSSLPESTHLLAAALLNYADDHGYFNANPALVKAACSPLREPSVSIRESLASLLDVGYLAFGTTPDGKRYGRIVKFSEHQRVDHPSKSKIAALSITWENTRACLASPREKLAQEQGTGNREGKGKEEDSARSSASSTPQPVHVEPAIALSPVFIALPVNAGRPFEIREAMVSEWEKLYPAVDVRQQLRTMAGWLDANPKRRKTASGVKRFVNNWLSKDQDRGGQVARAGAGARPRFDDGVPTVHVSRVEDIA